MKTTKKKERKNEQHILLFVLASLCPFFIWHSKASKLRWRKKIRLGRSSVTICQWSLRQSSLGWWFLAARHASVAGSSFDSCGTPACFGQSCASPVPLCDTAELSCRISASCFAGRWDPGPALWHPCHFWCPGFPGGCFHVAPSAQEKRCQVNSYNYHHSI